MSKPSKKKKQSNFVITIRSEIQPTIGASIFRRVGLDGHAEMYFETKRAFSRDGGKTFEYSSRMYPRHAPAIADATKLAAEWIEKHPEAADGPLCPSDDGQLRFAANAPQQSQ